MYRLAARWLLWATGALAGALALAFAALQAGGL